MGKKKSKPFEGDSVLLLALGIVVEYIRFDDIFNILLL